MADPQLHKSFADDNSPSIRNQDEHQSTISDTKHSTAIELLKPCESLYMAEMFKHEQALQPIRPRSIAANAITLPKLMHEALTERDFPASKVKKGRTAINLADYTVRARERIIVLYDRMDKIEDRRTVEWRNLRKQVLTYKKRVEQR